MRLKNALIMAICGTLCLCILVGGSGCGSNITKLSGGGASFPAPLYTKWFKDFSKEHKDIQIDYQNVGSGRGKSMVIDGTVDFGASDAAMTEEEMAKVSRGVVLLPMTAGAIVIVYNLEGVKDLKLPRDVYPLIFTKDITKWSDERIKKANPGVNLPDKDITVVVRADKSGTTYVFTKHLAKISEIFEKKVGNHEAPSWGDVKGPQNQGVAQQVEKNDGSIGYVEYGYAKSDPKLHVAVLENKAKKFVNCTPETSKTALASIELPENLIGWLPDPPGEEAWPIVSYTWMIFYKGYSDEKKLKAIKDMVRYALHEGQKSSVESGYVPLPEAVVSRNEKALEQIQLAK